MFQDSDYTGQTMQQYYEEYFEDARDAREAAAPDTRMEAFDAGQCTLGAAYSGGSRYEAEMIDAVGDWLAERGVARLAAAGVHLAMSEWQAGQRKAA